MTILKTSRMIIGFFCATTIIGLNQISYAQNVETALICGTVPANSMNVRNRENTVLPYRGDAHVTLCTNLEIWVYNAKLPRYEQSAKDVADKIPTGRFLLHTGNCLSFAAKNHIVVRREESSGPTMVAKMQYCPNYPDPN